MGKIVPRLYIKLVLPIALIFLALSLTARASGRTPPPNLTLIDAAPAMRGFVENCDDQPGPCWHGIVLGITPGRKIRQYLEAAGYRIPDVIPPDSTSFIWNSTTNVEEGLCTVSLYVSNDVAENLDLRFCRDSTFTIRDIVALRGTPDAISTTSGQPRTIVYGGAIVPHFFMSWPSEERVANVYMMPYGLSKIQPNFCPNCEG